MKKTALAAFLIAMTPVAAQADLLFTVGAKANAWTAEPSGQVDDGVSADSETDGLGLDSDSGTNLTVFFEHPVPVLPNVRLRQTSLDLDGSGTMTRNFNGVQYTGQVDSYMDLSHTDATLYWGLPLPVPYVDINLGLTARMFGGEVIVEGTTLTGNQREEVELDFAIPMGFLEAQVGTPFGIYAQAEINAIGYDGNALTDTVLTLGYDLPVPVVDLGLEVGHRAMSMKTNKDTTDIETDFDVSGIFYGASFSVGF
ncbi:MAG: TIGR04219 family outer membrane beta-barrel protein [Pseudomonadota bacterium]|nr:TIGR04219 family outer membrane beta-barrel protein [Pseudomonadota bacterium]